MSKLNFYGIIGTAYEWIKSDIRNGYQRVKIKNKNSITKAFSDWDLENTVFYKYQF